MVAVSFVAGPPRVNRYRRRGFVLASFLQVAFNCDMGTVETLVGATYEGRYAIERVLSIGGMGTLFKATQLAVQRPVCVRVVNPDKVVDPQKVERFITEARKLASLTHANVIDLIDFGQDAQGRLFLVRDYLEGERLHQLIAREAPLAPERIAHICSQILDPLAQAHQQGIVHRELNPRNIFVTEIGQTRDFIKLLEFRIADARDDTWVKQDRELPYYTPPELLTDGIPVDDRTDLYALGCILYELLTGHVPFAYREYEDVRRAQIHEPPPPPYIDGIAVRGRLVDLINACLQKDPERRPHDAADALAILRDGVGPLVTSAPDVPIPVPELPSAYAPNPLASTVRDPVELQDLNTRPERLGTGPLLRHQTTTIRHTGATSVGLDADCALPGGLGAPPTRRRSVLPFVIVGILLCAGAFAAMVLFGEDSQADGSQDDARRAEAKRTEMVDQPASDDAPNTGATAQPEETPATTKSTDAGTDSPQLDDRDVSDTGNAPQDAASGTDLGSKSDDIATDTANQDGATAEKPSGPIELTIKTVPSNAVLYNRSTGKPVTRTPATLKFLVGQQHLLRVVKPGYEAQDLTLSDASKSMTVVLKKKAPATVPPKNGASTQKQQKKKTAKKKTAKKKKKGGGVKDFLP